MRFILVSLDETQYWSEDIQAKCGAIFGLYVYCPDRAHHCCEVKPSYELWPVQVWSAVPPDEEMEIAMRSYFADAEIAYIYCSALDAEHNLDAKLDLGDFGEEGDTYEECVDQVIEYLIGNYRETPNMQRAQQHFCL